MLGQWKSHIKQKSDLDVLSLHPAHFSSADCQNGACPRKGRQLTWVWLLQCQDFDTTPILQPCSEGALQSWEHLGQSWLCVMAECTAVVEEHLAWRLLAFSSSSWLLLLRSSCYDFFNPVPSQARMGTISNKKVLEYEQPQWWAAIMEEERRELQSGSLGSDA